MMSQIRVFNCKFFNNEMRFTVRNLSASAIAATLWIIPASGVSAGQMVADANENDYEVLSFAQHIGRVRANSEICGAEKGVDLAQVEDVTATATFVAKARYRQLGLTEDDEAEDEKTGEQGEKINQDQNPRQLHCEIIDRQLDALIWRAAYQGADFIRRSQKKSGP